MQHLNDDMDDLFRKAAEHYPLNTGKPNWDKVVDGLSKDDLTPPAPARWKYRRFLWLFILVPSTILSLIIYRYAGSTDDNHQPQEAEVAGSKTITGQPAPLTNEGLSNEGKINKNIDDSSLMRDQPFASESHRAATSGSPESATTAPHQPATTGIKVGNTAHSKSRSKQDIPRNKYNSRAERNTLPDPKEQRPATREQNFSKQDASTARASGVPKDSRRIHPDKPVDDLRGAHTDESSLVNKELFPFSSLSRASVSTEVNTDKIQPTPFYMPSATAPKYKSSGDKKFYLGLAGGLDLSSVSLQKTSKTGYHYGALLGYRLSQKWSVEAGFFVDNKYYFTEGKYFDKGKVYLPANTTLLSADGFCKMFEVPFSLKYDIRNSYRSNLFITAGLSSYIMKEEDYNLVYLYNSGSQSVHPRSWSNTTKNIFSQLRFTAGYGIKLPAGLMFRVEPYVNLPVGRVGYGKLKLVSAGANAGLFKSIF